MDDRLVIVDVDGTLALFTGRHPFDWHRVHEDEPNEPVAELVRLLARTGTEIVFLSGRDAVCRPATEQWIAEHVIDDPVVLMRPAGDNRSDREVKLELFHGAIGDPERVWFVLDDRDSVVSMWRDELGLTCLQVAPGDF